MNNNKQEMVEDKHFEELVNGLLEKGFDGQFIATETYENDIRTCLKSYLDGQPAGQELYEVFPVQLRTFIDGDRTCENYTQVILELDYNKDHGFYFSGLQANRQTGQNIEGLTINNIIWGPAYIPSIKRIKSMEFEKSAVKGPVHPSWLDTGLPVVNDRHMRDFVGAMEKKGYQGEFYTRGSERQDLANTIASYLTSRLKTERIKYLFPLSVTTSTESNSSKIARTECRFHLDFEPLKGISILSYSPIGWDLSRRIVVQPAKSIPVNSISELPTREELQKMAKHLIQNRDKRKGKSL